MRTLSLLLSLFAVLALASAHPPESDETQIRGQIHGYLDAWNRGNPIALASYWDSDGDRINNSGKLFRGRSEIRQHYEGVFSKELPPGIARHLSYGDIAVRFVTSDVAIVDIQYEASGVGPDPTITARGRNSVVMVKRDGAWLREAQRNAIPITGKLRECYRQCTSQ